MRRIHRKLAVLSALRANPEFSKLQGACVGSEREVRLFLQWLDQSGVALYLFWRLRESGNLGTVPGQFRMQLEKRLESNRLRTNAMLSELQRVSECFRKRGIRHAFLKGFTLVPAFSPEPALRHQSDIDILISEDIADEARVILSDYGYSPLRELRKGEIRFAMPLDRIPSSADDIYRADYHRQIELHTSIWDKVGRVDLEVPVDCLDRTRVRYIRGLAFVALAQEDAFLLQVLHAFRHFLSSWVRLSWLWEIHHFLASQSEDAAGWMAIRDRAGDDPVLMNAFGLILGLTNELFGSPIPEIVREWCIETLPYRVKCWLATFGTQWALSEIPGNKVTLFIHKEFIREPGLWKHLLRRIIPLAGRPSLGEINSPNAETAVRFSIEQQVFRARRLAHHANSLFSLSLKAFRWKHALMHAASNGNAAVRRRNQTS